MIGILLKLWSQQKNYFKQKKSTAISQISQVDIINALNKKDFEVNVPHQVAHRWNFNPEFSAFIYVAISDFRPRECKLGVTTLSPEIRANKYTTKYGYRITIYNYVDAINPYEIEAKIANDLSSLRVSKNTEGDSIEWYRMEPSEMFAIVQNEINKQVAIFIYLFKWFERDETVS